MRRWGTIWASGVVALGVALGVLLASHAAWAVGVAHHIAKVQIDPAKASLKIHDVIEFEGGGEMLLTLSPDFALQTITLNGKATKVSQERNQISLQLNRKGRHVLDLTYQSQSHPLLSAEGGFLDADWLAQPQGQMATWSIEGQISKGQKFITPGQFMFETEIEGQYRAGFQNFTPSPPPVLITGPFHVSEKMAGDVRIRTYFHKELKPLAQGYLDDAARYIGYYAGKIGPYPYPGFSIISGPAPVGWGLPGMTYMGRRVLALPFIRYTSLPHEVLHNWWGNAVEVDYVNGNWAEGLTTYQADHAIAQSRSKNGGRAKRLEWLRNYAALPPERDHALTEFRAKTHDASQVVGYGKTAFVFHMLKSQLGETVFDKALHRFNRTNHLGTAGWGEIQAAFETESGKALSIFFQAWTQRPGAPDLKLTKASANATQVTFTLSQEQNNSAFPLSIPVLIETDKGSEWFTAVLNTRSHDYVFTTQGTAKTLRVDPNTDVFRRLGQGERPPILRDVTLDPNTHLIALGSIDLRDEAQALAGNLLQARLRMLDPAEKAKTLIITGPRKMVREHLAQNGLPPAPDVVADQGDARVWTARSNSKQTLLVIEAEDAQGFSALRRVLPHYKRRSYVVMEKGQTTHKGTWPPTDDALSVKF